MSEPYGVPPSVLAEDVALLQSHASLVLKRDDDLDEREVVDHDKFDIDRLQDIEGLQDMKYSWQFKLETVLGVWILFNAISTSMIILTNVRRRVSPADRESFGHTEFAVVWDVVTYFPLVFFTLVVLLFNNYYSDVTFYMYLKRGAIIDFPPSASPKYMLKKLVVLLFLFFFLGYLGLAGFTMIYFKASIGSVAILLNNLLVGIGMAWYKQQAIEDKFVSLSNFIQAFPDRDGEYGNMDEQSLHSASRFITGMTLTEAHESSYSGYMRQYYWNHKNYSASWRVFLHVVVWAVIFVLAGVSVGYFMVLGRFDMESVWKETIQPCVVTCVNAARNDTGAMCTECLCNCMANLQRQDKDDLNACSDYFSFAPCGKSTCPDTCPGWKTD